MIDIYSGSIRFKFDLNFILRKLSFSGLVSLIHTIDFPNEYNHDEYNHDHKYITLMKYILSEVSEADFKHLTDFRNAVSHHDLMLNSLDLSVEEYEKKLNSIINIFKDNKIQSYSFQFDRNIDIKNMFESKLYGLISSYEKKMTNRNFGKFRNLMKFISQNYNSVFGRDILVEIINKQNPSIKKQEQEFTMTDLPISIEFLKDIFDDENGEILEMMYESN